MTITVDLSAATEQKLRERAAQAGQDVAALVRDLIERGVRTRPTFDEILVPFRAQVADSGMTDDDLAILFEEARDVSTSRSRLSD
jgi:hypothetical protein